jgi:beta-N-acetylhexosaminidase
MDAIAKTLGEERGALLGLRAGADIILISHRIAPQRGAIEMVQAAVRSGDLFADVIRAAAARVVHLKERHLTWDTLPTPVVADTVSTISHQQLRDRAYTRTTTRVRDDAGLLPLRLPPDARILAVAYPPDSVTRAVDIVYRHEFLVEGIRARHANVRGVCLGPGTSEADIEELLRSAESADFLLLVTINAHLDPRQAVLMRRLLATGRPAIGIAACNPYDPAALPGLKTYLATYEYTQPALSAAAEALFGAFDLQGRLPVSLPILAPITESSQC